MTKTTKRQWTIWTPSSITIEDHVSGDKADVGEGPRGRVYKPSDRIGGVTREEAQAIAAMRHGPEAIVTRRRGEPLHHAFEADLRQDAG